MEWVGIGEARYLVDVPGAGKAECCRECKAALDGHEQRTIETRYTTTRARVRTRQG
jgi:hypothetical protein